MKKTGEEGGGWNNPPPQHSHTQTHTHKNRLQETQQSHHQLQDALDVSLATQIPVHADV